MIRLNLVVEGYSEQAFANKVLRPYMSRAGIMVAASCVTTSRDPRTGQFYRGGGRDYLLVKNDLLRWMKSDKKRSVRFSTMIDLYALPRSFPGYEQSGERMGVEKAVFLEKTFADDIGDSRFIPYIQVHEFEALLMTDIRSLETRFPERRKDIQALAEDVKAWENPEDINERPDWAPSKRIIGRVPEYKASKRETVEMAAAHIGIDKMREKCPHFNDWLTRLEGLASA